MALVRTGGVPTALRHDGPLVESEWRGNSGVLDVVGMHSSLKEGVSHV